MLKYFRISAPVILIIMFFVKKYEAQESSVDQNENETKRKQWPKFSPNIRIVLIMLFMLSIFFYQTLELTMMLFGPTFLQYIPLHISAGKATKVTSILSTTYTVGRGVSALISSRVRASIMLSYHIAILAVSLVLLYFGQRNETILYIAMVTLGNFDIAIMLHSHIFI